MSSIDYLPWSSTEITLSERLGDRRRRPWWMYSFLKMSWGAGVVEKKGKVGEWIGSQLLLVHGGCLYMYGEVMDWVGIQRPSHLFGKNGRPIFF